MENIEQSQGALEGVAQARREATEVTEAAPRPAAGVELSIIVPTFNERENVRELVRRLNRCLSRQSWEIIFVDDDSADGTSDLVRDIAQSNCRVRCLQRIGRRGLSSACIEGMLSSAAPFVAVIDGDLQHDETLLPRYLGRSRLELCHDGDIYLEQPVPT